MRCLYVIRFPIIVIRFPIIVIRFPVIIIRFPIVIRFPIIMHTTNDTTVQSHRTTTISTPGFENIIIHCRII